MKKTKYLCAVCKDLFDFESIKYQKDGKTLICVSCLGRSSNPKSMIKPSQGYRAGFEKPATSQKEILSRLPEKKSKGYMINEVNSGKKKERIIDKGPVDQDIKVMCSECRYKFTRRIGTRIKPVCPYCGKATVVHASDVTERFIEN